MYYMSRDDKIMVATSLMSAFRDGKLFWNNAVRLFSSFNWQNSIIFAGLESNAFNNVIIA